MVHTEERFKDDRHDVGCKLKFNICNLKIFSSFILNIKINKIKFIINNQSIIYIKNIIIII